MENKPKLQDSNAQTKKDEQKLSNINLFFSAYGNFLNGIFCISQYYISGKPLFGYITLGIVAIILLATYGISYAKASVRNERLWAYITRCANALGPLNPAFLILGIVFALNANHEIIMVWIGMEFLQVACYVIAFRKSFPNFGSSFTLKMRSWIKSNIALIVTSLIAILFGVLWYFSPEDNRYGDLWLNLSAGFIASSITISVIERILKKQRESSERPLRQAMYRDIQLFTSRFISFWQELYLHSVEDRTNMTVEKFFSPESIEKIRSSLDLSCMANVYPEQTWFSHIENTRKDLENRGQKILTTYSSIAEPEVLQAIHYLINDSAYLGRLALIAQTHMYDVREHIPRPTLLASYTLEPKAVDSSMVSQLLEWCYTQYDKLQVTHQEATTIILPVTSQLDFQNYKTQVTSAITEDKLSKMLSEYDRWKQSREQ